MTIERFNAVVKQRPFQPFTIHTADGEKVRVKSPEFVWLPPKSRTLYVATGQGVDDEHVEYIDLLLVTKLSVGPENAPRKVGRGR